MPTPLSEAIERVMDDLVPGCEVIPLHLTGFTDSRWFREAFPDIVAYGFCPFVANTEFLRCLEKALSLHLFRIGSQLWTLLLQVNSP